MRANLPAAPTQWQPVASTTGVTYMTGLTIREHFAAMAMQGLCAASGDGYFSIYKDLGLKSADELLTKVAVNLADALIAELAKVSP